MKKVHISLVGGQPVPVYIGIKDDCQAGDIILVCSPQSLEEANRIKTHFLKRMVRIEECSPVNLSEIEMLTEKLRNEFEACEVTLNLTSGTKLWTLSFFRVFSQMNSAQFIYVDQTNTITDILTKETHKGEIPHITRFELYGTPLTSYVPLTDYDRADFDVMSEVEKIRKINRRDFTLLTGSCDKRLLENNEVIPATVNGSSIKYDYWEKWVTINLQGYNGFVKSQTFRSPHVFDIVFNSGWFELKVAHELNKNPHVKEVWLNCEFSDTEGNPKNEIDIICDLGNRLLFVECKTMIKDTTDIDKFRSALRNFSGTSTTGLFVTNDHPKKEYKHAMEKCRDNGILTFNFARWREAPLQSVSLDKIIESQLFTQNKR